PVRPRARVAVVAVRGGRRAGPRVRGEVVGPVLPRGVRRRVGAVGRDGTPDGGGRAPVGGRARARRGPGRARHAPDGGPRLPRRVDVVVPLPWRVHAPVGAGQPGGGRRVAATRAAVPVGVPPEDVGLPQRAHVRAHVRGAPARVDPAVAADVVLLALLRPGRGR